MPGGKALKVLLQWRWWMAFPRKLRPSLVLGGEQLWVADLRQGCPGLWPLRGVTYWANRRGIFQLWTKTWIRIPIDSQTYCMGVRQVGETRCWGLFVSAASVPRLWLSTRKLATDYLACNHVLNLNTPVLRVLLLQAVCYWASYLPPQNSFFLPIKYGYYSLLPQVVIVMINYYFIRA